MFHKHKSPVVVEDASSNELLDIKNIGDKMDTDEDEDEDLDHSDTSNSDILSTKKDKEKKKIKSTDNTLDLSVKNTADEMDTDDEDEDHDHSDSSDTDILTAQSDKEKKKIKSTDRSLNLPVKNIADVMTNLLSKNETGESVILSQISKKIKLEAEEDEKKIKARKKKKLSKRKLKNRGRIMPGMEEYEKERAFKVLATQGVVQLFTTISKHKMALSNELQEAKGMVQKEKVLAVKGKDYFMNLLQREGDKLKPSDKMEIKQKIKKEKGISDEEDTKSMKIEPGKTKSKWSALAENYYKDSSLTGWDKDDSDDD